MYIFLGRAWSALFFIPAACLQMLLHLYFAGHDLGWHKTSGTATACAKCCDSSNKIDCARDRMQGIGSHVDAAGIQIWQESILMGSCLIIASLSSASSGKTWKKDATSSKTHLISSCCPSQANDATPEAVDTLNWSHSWVRRRQSIKSKTVPTTRFNRLDFFIQLLMIKYY